MSERVTLPEVIVFAGPNGSGKSTITRMAKTVGTYINADDIKLASHCSDLEAALAAERLREDMIARKADFTFETVLSTDRNLKLLKRAKENGYFVRCIYVLTVSPTINVMRVSVREAAGGHSVPEDKIRSRYAKALALLPELVDVCDGCTSTTIRKRHFGSSKSGKMFFSAGPIGSGPVKRSNR